MRDRGYRRSPDGCREKWRSLVRKLKNNQHHNHQHSRPPSPFFRDSTFDSYHLNLETLQPIPKGVTIKLYHYDECNGQAISSEDATLYCEDDFHELLTRNGWQSLREVGTYKDVESIQDLRPMASYHSSGIKELNM
uniref:Myb-like domain-containing protein n=1 Tax=Nelumbo nucifera TaxID=4432 RepID=A0A822ZDI1_NELNU|nr:TPA_asm: hypothetical protein HUJ06_016064 [Nelumbo nucifera]